MQRAALMSGRRALAGGSTSSGSSSSSSFFARQRPLQQPQQQQQRRARLVAAAAAATAAAPSPAGADPDPEGRRAHNAVQAAAFSGRDVLNTFGAPLPPEISERLARVARAACGGKEGAAGGGAPAAAAPPSPPPRVIDVGAGTGCMVPHLRACGVEDILAVDLSEDMLAELRRAHGGGGRGGGGTGGSGSPSSPPLPPAPPSAQAQLLLLGNAPGARTWCGDFVDLPAYMGPADAVVFNAVWGNMHDPRRALLRASLLLRPGGRAVISHPLGRAWHERLRLRAGSGSGGQATTVPHALPAGPAALAELARGLPLVVEEGEFVDEGGADGREGLYCAVLSVPPHYALDARAVPAAAAASPASSPSSPSPSPASLSSSPSWSPPVLRMEAPIVRGFGRGSRQLGVPTANLDPRVLAAALPLAGLPRGVYFGWARLVGDDGRGPSDAGGGGGDYAVHPMVMNVGLRPTVNVGGLEDASVEVHVMHRFSPAASGAAGAGAAAGAAAAAAATGQEDGGGGGGEGDAQTSSSFAEFYGAHMRVVVTGFLRPEMRFDGLAALVSRIKADIGVSKAQLQAEDGPHERARRDAFFFGG